MSYKTTISSLSAAQANLAGVRASMERQSSTTNKLKVTVARLKNVISAPVRVGKADIEAESAAEQHASELAAAKRELELVKTAAAAREKRLQEREQSVKLFAEENARALETELARAESLLVAAQKEAAENGLQVYKHRIAGSHLWPQLQGANKKIKLQAKEQGAQREALQNEIDAYATELDSVKTDLHSAHSAVQQHQQAAEQAQAQAAYAHQEWAHYYNVCNENQMTIAGLMNRNHQLESENASTKQTLDTVGKELLKAQNDLIVTRADATVNGEELAIEKKNTTIISTDLYESKEKVTALTAELDKTKIELAAYKSPIEVVEVDEPATAIEAFVATELVSALEPGASIEPGTSTELDLTPITVTESVLSEDAMRISDVECKDTLTDINTDQTFTASEPEVAKDMAPTTTTETNGTTISTDTDLPQKSDVTYTGPNHLVVNKPMNIKAFKKTEDGTWFAVLEDPVSPQDLLVDAIENKLAITEAELVSTTAKLTAKDAELTATAAELTSTKDILAGIKTDLSTKDAKLTSTLAELATKDAQLISKDAALTSTKRILSDTKASLSISATALTTTQAELTTAKMDRFTAEQAKLKLETVAKTYACDKSSSCSSCPLHMERALRVSRAAEAQAGKLIDEAHINYMRAWNELHDYEIQHARSQSSDTWVEGNASPVAALEDAAADEEEDEEEDVDDDTSDCSSECSSIVFIGDDGPADVEKEVIVASEPPEEETVVASEPLKEETVVASEPPKEDTIVTPPPSPTEDVFFTPKTERTAEPVELETNPADEPESKYKRRSDLPARAYIPPHLRKKQGGFAARSFAQHMPGMVGK